MLQQTMAIKSVEIYYEALDFLMKRAKLLGLNILDQHYKQVNILSMFVLLDAITYTLVTIYCVFEFSGDLEKLVFCLVTYGFAIQVRIKFEQRQFG